MRRAAGAAVWSFALGSLAAADPASPTPGEAASSRSAETGTARGAVESASPDEPRTILFNSSEIGASAYGNTGFKRSLGTSLHQDGFILMGNAGVGQRREVITQEERRITVDHLSSEGSLLLGYQWRTDRAFISVLAGPEIDLDQPLVDGWVVALNRPSYGGRMLAEVWAHPGENTLLVGTLVLGTAPKRAWGRIATGWRVWGPVFVGPEAVVSAEETYRELRLGIAATGFQIGRWTFSVSGGVLAAEGARPGGYAGLTTVFRP